MISFSLILFSLFYVSYQTGIEVTPSSLLKEKQNGTASVRSTNCTLPAYPDHGTFDILNGNNTSAQTYYDALLLSVSCHQGYGIDGMPYGQKTVLACIQGIWYDVMPKCVPFCKLDPTLEPSVEYICNSKIMGPRRCGDFVQHGTVVNPRCKRPLYYSSEILANMECTNGQWNYVAKCKAECGKVTPIAPSLIISSGGRNATLGQVPWHVGLYRKTSTIYEQICGGTIITNKVVISAAHCIWNSALQKAFPPSDFTVAGGKIFRLWEDNEDKAQKSDVKEIKTPSLYQGAVGNFGVDIAGLILVTPFVYSLYLKPVCLNFDNDFERWQLQHGKLGKAAGWGLISANGNYSPILQIVDLPFINDGTCLTTVPKHFRQYITGDKFCAGFTNGTALCKGDSGGGLAFPEINQGIERFYFRGVVSTAARDEDNNICNDHTYTAFTKITIHQDFIRSIIAVSEEKSLQCQGAVCNVRPKIASRDFNEFSQSHKGVDIFNTSIPKLKRIMSDAFFIGE